MVLGTFPEGRPLAIIGLEPDVVGGGGGSSGSMVCVCVCVCVYMCVVCVCVCVCVCVQGVLGEGEQSQPILERGNGASLVVLFSKRVYCWCGRKALDTAECGLDCLLPLVWCG